MASTGTDTAKFVITGEFVAGNLIKQVEAAIGELSKKIEQGMTKSGHKISKSISDGMSKGVKDATTKARANMKQLGDEAAGVSDDTDKISKSMKKVNADIFTAVKRVLLWGTASRLIYDSYGRIKDAVQDVITLNKILVNIQKIRPAGLDTDFITEDIISKAKRFGVAFEEIGETQRTFYQQGFNTVQVSKLTEAQLLAVTAAGLSASEAMELLVSSMTIFGIEAEQSVSLIDKLQNVQANYAVSTQDIATAMRRVGPVAQQLGGDIDHLIGVITALKTSTRKSGEFIGTALSTIFSRMITDVGANQLRRIGIDINETATQLRPLRDILNETAIKWKELSDQEKIATAFALGARRRYAQVIALFEEYPTVLAATATATNAFGAALIAQEKEVKSVSRQMAIASQTAKEAGIAFINAFAVNDTIAEDFNRLAQGMKTFSTVTKKLAPQLAFLSKALGFAAVVTALHVAHNVLAKRMSEVTIKAIIGKVALDNYNSSMALGQGRAVAFGIALSSLNWGVLIAQIVAVGAGILAMNWYLKKSTKDVNNLSDAYANFGKQTEIVKRTLAEYQSISEQFNTVGGKRSLDDLLGVDLDAGPGSIVGVLIKTADLTKEVNSLTFDKWVAAVKEVRGESASLEDAYKDLSNAIGYFQATSAGLRKELEQMKSDSNEAVVSITTLAIAIGKAVNARNVEYTGDSFLKEFFGYDSADDLEKELNKISKSLKTIVLPDELSDAAALENMAEELYKEVIEAYTKGLGDVPFGKLAQEQGAYGEVFSTIFMDNLIKGIAEKRKLIRPLSGLDDQLSTEQVFSLKFDIEDASSEDLLEALEKTTAEIKNTDVAYEAFKKNLEGKGIDMGKFLLGKPDLKEMESVAKDIESIVTTQIPNYFKQLEKEINPFLGLMLEIQIAARQASPSAGFVPKNVTTTLKNMTIYAHDTAKLAESFTLAAANASTFGKNLSEVRLSALTSDLKEANKQLAKKDTAKDQIESWTKIRQAYLDYVDELGFDADKNQKEMTKMLEVVDRYSQKIADLASEMTIMGQVERDLLFNQARAAARYAALSTHILNTKNAYKLNTVELKASSAALIKEIKSIEKYEKTIARLSTQINKLYTGGSFVEGLAQDLNLITRNYDIQRDSILDQIKAQKALYVEQKAELDLKTELLSFDEKGRRIEPDLDLNKEYQNQLASLENANTAKLLNLKYSLELLNLEIEQQKSVARTNDDLNRRKAIQKANLASINEIFSAMEKSAEASREFSSNIANIAAEFAGLDTGGSYFKTLRVEQALITREQEIQRQGLLKDIALTKEKVIAKQNEYDIGKDLLSSDIGRLGVLKDANTLLAGMTDEAKKGLNLFVLESRAKLESYGYALKQLDTQGKYNQTVAELNNLLEISNDIFSANEASIQNIASGMNTAVGATKEYNQAVIDIVSNMQLLGTTGEFGKQLRVEITKITDSYKDQKKALVAQESIIKATIKAQQQSVGFWSDVLVTELSIKDIKEENLLISKDQQKAGINTLNSISLQGREELKNLEIQRKQLDIDEARALKLAEANVLLKAMQDTQADINQLAAGYGSAVGDIVTNISKIATERGGLRTLLQPFADAYLSSVTSRLSKSIQYYLDDVLESSVGGQLKQLEEDLKRKTQAEPYEAGGEILKKKLLEGQLSGADIFKDRVVQAHSIGADTVGNKILSSQELGATLIYNKELAGHSDGGDILYQRITEAIGTFKIPTPKEEEERGPVIIRDPDGPPPIEPYGLPPVSDSNIQLDVQQVVHAIEGIKIPEYKFSDAVPFISSGGETAVDAKVTIDTLAAQREFIAGIANAANIVKNKIIEASQHLFLKVPPIPEHITVDEIKVPFIPKVIEVEDITIPDIPDIPGHITVDQIKVPFIPKTIEIDDISIPDIPKAIVVDTKEAQIRLLAASQKFADAAPDIPKEITLTADEAINNMSAGIAAGASAVYNKIIAGVLLADEAFYKINDGFVAGASVIHDKIIDAGREAVYLSYAPVKDPTGIDVSNAYQKFLDTYKEGARIFQKVLDSFEPIVEVPEVTVPKVEIPSTIGIDVAMAEQAFREASALIYTKIISAAKTISIPDIEFPNIEIPDFIAVNIDKATQGIEEAYRTSSAFLQKNVVDTFNSIKLPEIEIPEYITVNAEKAKQGIVEAYNTSSAFLQKNVIDTFKNIELPDIEVPEYITVSIDQANQEIEDAYKASSAFLQKNVVDTFNSIKLPEIVVPEYITVNVDKAKQGIEEAYRTSSDFLQNDLINTFKNITLPEISTPEDIVLDTANMQQGLTSSFVVGSKLVYDKIVEASKYLTIDVPEIPKKVEVDFDNAEKDLKAFSEGFAVAAPEASYTVTLDSVEAQKELEKSFYYGGQLIQKNIEDGGKGLVLLTPYIPKEIKVETEEVATSVSSGITDAASIIETKIASAGGNLVITAPDIPTTLDIDISRAQREFVEGLAVAADSLKAKIVEAGKEFNITVPEIKQEVQDRAIETPSFTVEQQKAIDISGITEALENVTIIPPEVSVDVPDVIVEKPDPISTRGIELALDNLNLPTPQVFVEVKVDKDDEDVPQPTAEVPTLSLESISSIDAQSTQPLYNTIAKAHADGALLMYNSITAATQGGLSGEISGALPQQVAKVTNYEFDTVPITSGLSGVENGVNVMTVKQVENTAEGAKTTKNTADQVNKQKLTIAAIQGLGIIMGNLVGGSGEGAQLGAQIGGAIGSAFGPIGSVIGSFAGGIFGGIFDDAPEQEPVEIPANIYEANSDALAQNTAALLRNAQNFDFMRKLLNAPANFIQPAYAGLGGGANVTVQINAPVGNENAVGKAVYDAVSKVYSNDYRRIGRRG